MKKFLIHNWFKVGVLAIGLIFGCALLIGFAFYEPKNIDPHFKDNSLKSAIPEVITPTTSIPTNIKTPIPANNSKSQPTPTKTVDPEPTTVDPAIKIAKCKATANLSADTVYNILLQAADTQEQNSVKQLQAKIDAILNQNPLPNGWTLQVRIYRDGIYDVTHHIHDQVMAQLLEKKQELYNIEYSTCLNKN
jgi:hypothetical protein